MEDLILAVVALGLGAFAAATTLTALVRLRRPVALAIPIVTASWLTGELPLYHLASQVVAVVVLAALGTFDRVIGMAGLALMVATWPALVFIAVQAARAGRPLRAALEAGLGTALAPPDRRDRVPWSATFTPLYFPHKGVEIRRNIAYGGHGHRNLLDVYIPTRGLAPFPMVIQVHGGFWLVGNKRQQAIPLLLHLAKRGYACLSINYRMGLRVDFPEHLIDVKRAIAWAKANAGDIGGDPSFVALTGGSAGGHLASLAALTPTAADYQPGFEDQDTTVQACVPFYPPSDFTNHFGLRRTYDTLTPFLRIMVMHTSFDRDRVGWERASPIYRINAGAPPFMIVQGALDVLVWREETAAFAEELRKTSRREVVYAELPGAQHNFDIFSSVRTRHAVRAVTRFLDHVRARSRDRGG